MWVNNKSWLVVKNVMFFNAFVSAIVGGIFGLVTDWKLPSGAWIAIAFAMFCGVYVMQWPSRNMVKKIFASSKQDADQIVTHILQKKGLPYEHGKIFELADTEVRIKTQYIKNRRSHFGGVIVSIGPITNKNLPLIKSLQQKIDMGFQPRGLS